jgi:hypothetical protein
MTIQGVEIRDAAYFRVTGSSWREAIALGLAPQAENSLLHLGG